MCMRMGWDLSYWLVGHPWISEFEWKQGVTHGSSPSFLAVCLLAYLFFTCFFLRRTAARRLRSPVLRPITAAHDVFIFLLSSLMTAGCAASLRAQMPSLRWVFCFPAGARPKGPVFFWVNLFYLSKIYEFVDTLIIALGGGTRRLTFLHVYHHTMVVVMCYLWLWRSQSLCGLGLITNSSVHTLMYAYYLLCALGLRPPWKRAVTVVQIAQFVFGFAVSAVMLLYHFTTSDGCSGLDSWFFNLFFNTSLLLLFLDFHAKNYSRKTARVKQT